jgi:hypothetical protein
VREPDSRFILTTYDAYNDLICMGSYDGKIFLYSIERQLYVHKAFEITKPAFEGQIVNCIKFLD